MRRRPATTVATAGVRRRPGRSGRVCLATAVVLTVVGGVLAASPVTGQVAASDEVRIVARKLATGKIELGLQQQATDSSWGDRRLPRTRLFPTTAPTDRWLVSSPLTLTALPDSQPVPPHEQAARALLARTVGAEPQDFQLDSSEGVQWSDASLGCPEPGYVYAAVIVPGYRLVFNLDGTSYQVHTNDDGSQAVICETGL